MFATRFIHSLGRVPRAAAAFGLLAFASLVAGLACSKDPGPTSDSGTHGAAGAIPASFALASEPAGAKGVAEVIATAKTGDEVVLRGRVGEATDGVASFLLVDPSLKSCNEESEMPDCDTPWDFCCTPADEKMKLMANVELRNGDKLVPGTVLGFQGLDHLQTVVVKGTAKKDSAGNLSVVASGLYVKK